MESKITLFGIPAAGLILAAGVVVLSDYMRKSNRDERNNVKWKQIQQESAKRINERREQLEAEKKKIEKERQIALEEKEANKPTITTNKIVVDFYNEIDYNKMADKGLVPINTVGTWRLLEKKKPKPDVYYITSDRLYIYKLVGLPSGRIQPYGFDNYAVRMPVDSIQYSSPK